MQVRTFKQDDQTEYYQMAEAFYHSDAAVTNITKGQLRRTFQEIMKNSPYVKGMMLCEASQIVGYALLTFSWSCEMDGIIVTVDELFIKPKYRSHRYGSQFFKWLETAYDIDDYSYFLEVNPENPRARKLYERLGYRTCPYIAMLKS
ncbi:MAG: GNAT family N-acetyltransferase [Erysipelotrichaceae bacterium]|uniref:GNAT family N-acetyltransferase n=1 Tax=Copranaerobaculum intestinale TaxID=2692629 RepID=A0A6N8UDE3_9FIRM|nr:GNAT family N-acetyltransferase [Copranaerobaculum intestinale]MBS6374949.1 GNAT family N-acetyltransferase [Erysipelotrichaceae bacterium]MXQ74449.1 GNAT family N-acetyltransferase [Copranaerobaculum intestinale]